MYMINTNIPPIKIKNNEYENQKVFVNMPEKRAVKSVWNIKKSPRVRGCWRLIKINLFKMIIKIKKSKILTIL